MSFPSIPIITLPLRSLLLHWTMTTAFSLILPPAYDPMIMSYTATQRIFLNISLSFSSLEAFKILQSIHNKIVAGGWDEGQDGGVGCCWWKSWSPKAQRTRNSKVWEQKRISQLKKRERENSPFLLLFCSIQTSVAWLWCPPTLVRTDLLNLVYWFKC